MSGQKSSGASESRVRELSLLASSHQLDDIKENEDGDQKNSRKKGGNSDARQKKENGRSNDAGSIKEMRFFEDGINWDRAAKGKNVLKSRKATRLGSSERSSTTLLPKKGILLAILKRLQKKDIYKVFSVPVDPKKLPDYHGVIKYPMDYGTITRKLDGGAYNNLEELEADVFLLCSNAMHYNGEDTVYYKQARTMKALAEKSFAELRGEPEEDYQPQPKARILKANKKRKSKAPMDRNLTNKVNANEGAKEQKLEVPNQAKAMKDLTTPNSAVNQPQHDKALVRRDRGSAPLCIGNNPKQSNNNNNNNTTNYKWNDEFPAHVPKGDMRSTRKRKIPVDMKGRQTYKKVHVNESDIAFNLQAQNAILADPFNSTRSLAKFTGDLGPVAWNFSSNNIEAMLPPRTPFGPGWVGQRPNRQAEPAPQVDSLYEALKKSIFPGGYNDPKKPILATTSNTEVDYNHGLPDEMVEAVRKLNSQQEEAAPSKSNAPAPVDASWKLPASRRQREFVHPEVLLSRFSPYPKEIVQVPRRQGQESVNPHRVQSNVAAPPQSSWSSDRVLHQMQSTVAAPFSSPYMLPFSNVQANPVHHHIKRNDDYTGFFNAQQYHLNPQVRGNNYGGLSINLQNQSQGGNNFGGVFFLGQQNQGSGQVSLPINQDPPHMHGNSHGELLLNQQNQNNYGGGFFLDEQNQGSGMASFPTSQDPLNISQMHGNSYGGLLINQQNPMHGNNYEGFFNDQQDQGSGLVSLPTDQHQLNPQMQGNIYGGLLVDQQNQMQGNNFGGLFNDQQNQGSGLVLLPTDQCQLTPQIQVNNYGGSFIDKQNQGSDLVPFPSDQTTAFESDFDVDLFLDTINDLNMLGEPAPLQNNFGNYESTADHSFVENNNYNSGSGQPSSLNGKGLEMSQKNETTNAPDVPLQTNSDSEDFDIFKLYSEERLFEYLCLKF